MSTKISDEDEERIRTIVQTDTDNFIGKHGEAEMYARELHKWGEKQKVKGESFNRRYFKYDAVFKSFLAAQYELCKSTSAFKALDIYHMFYCVLIYYGKHLESLGVNTVYIIDKIIVKHFKEEIQPLINGGDIYKVYTPPLGIRIEPLSVEIAATAFLALDVTFRENCQLIYGETRVLDGGTYHGPWRAPKDSGEQRYPQ